MIDGRMQNLACFSRDITLDQFRSFAAFQAEDSQNTAIVAFKRAELFWTIGQH